MLQGKKGVDGEIDGETPADSEVLPLTDTTNESSTTKDANGTAKKTAAPRKQRGPPEDGVASKTKIMVANLPYEMTEEKVCTSWKVDGPLLTLLHSSSRSSRPTVQPLPKLLFDLSPSSWFASSRHAMRLARVVVSASSLCQARRFNKRLAPR